MATADRPSPTRSADPPPPTRAGQTPGPLSWRDNVSQEQSLPNKMDQKFWVFHEIDWDCIIDADEWVVPKEDPEQVLDDRIEPRD
jgi:hypothetical protein